jgi:hypothetical protein
MSRVEFLSLGLGQIDLKFAGGADEPGTFEGYGSVFNVRDSYDDEVAPGAFMNTLTQAKASGVWPAMLLQHGSFLGGDDDMPVGIWTHMDEDERGLRCVGKLADTQRGRDTYKLLTMQPRPAISGLSIGFMAKKFTLGTKAGQPRRTLEAVDLLECSIVTWPANAKAQIDGVRSIRGLEQVLRDAGLSRREAKALLSGGYREIAPRDVGAELNSLLDTLRRANGGALPPIT